MRKSILAVKFFICSTVQFAQGEGAMSFLAVHPSAFYYASGHIGVTDPIDDPSGFYDNPAVFGRISQKTRSLSFQIHSSQLLNGIVLSFKGFSL
jgi:hypothetical protein